MKILLFTFLMIVSFFAFSEIYVNGNVKPDLTTSTSGVTISALGDLTIVNATASANGLLTSTDWTTFNGKESVLTFNAPLSRSTNTVSVPAATSLVDGYLDNADWTTFNNKSDVTTLNSLSDVLAPSPTLDEVLRWNGVDWVNSPPGSASATPGIEFFNATPSIEADDANNDIPINSLSKTPVTTAEQTVSGTAVSNTVTFAAWLYDTVLNRTTIDSGMWDFNTYAAVNSVAGGRVTTLHRAVYSVLPQDGGAVTITTTGSGTSRTVTASGGTPFTHDALATTATLCATTYFATCKIFESATATDASFIQTPQGLYQITARTSDTVVTITTPSGYANEAGATFNVWQHLFGASSPTITSTGTNYSLWLWQSAQPAFTITALHKLGAISFVTSNNTTTLTLTYNGTTRNTHFDTPLITMHGNLAGLQGGTGSQYYHLTSAEYTGTGTGNFVRLDSPAVTTKLTTTGNIGIGTTSPTHALEVNTTSWFGGNVGIGITNPTNKLAIKSGGLEFNGSTSGTVTFTPPAAPTPQAYTLTTNYGSSGQSLTTDGSGGLSWSDANSIRTNGGIVERLESVVVSNSGTPTVARQSGSWVSSLGDTATGVVTINITANIFADAPTCVCSVHGTTGMCNVSDLTSSVAVIYTSTYLNVDADMDFDVVCIGPKGTL